MVDTAQGILIFVISALTILLAILGFQVFLILKEFKKTIQKANKVLEDVGNVTQTISSPLTSLFSLTEGIKAGNWIAGFFKRKSKPSQTWSKKSKSGDGDEDE